MGPTENDVVGALRSLSDVLSGAGSTTKHYLGDLVDYVKQKRADLRQGFDDENITLGGKPVRASDIDNVMMVLPMTQRKFAAGGSVMDNYDPSAADDSYPQQEEGLQPADISMLFPMSGALGRAGMALSLMGHSGNAEAAPGFAAITSYLRNLGQHGTADALQAAIDNPRYGRAILKYGNPEQLARGALRAAGKRVEQRAPTQLELELMPTLGALQKASGGVVYPRS